SAETERALEELAEQYLARLRAGEVPDRRALVEAHPHLGDLLDRRLALVELLHRLARTQEVAHEATVAVARPADSQSPTTPRVETDRPATPPAHFGDFEVLGEIGRGAMGGVYRARQRSLNRTVALKVILAGASARLQDRIRFQLEAEAAASLDHPNVVRV